jgi:arylformamidase
MQASIAAKWGAALISVLSVLPLHTAAQSLRERLTLRRTAAASHAMLLPVGARVERDIAYGPDPAQRLDVYLPPHAEHAPVIFMVHGGGWMFGDKDSSGVVANKAAHWLPSSYIVMSTNYRLSPSANPLKLTMSPGHWPLPRATPIAGARIRPGSYSSGIPPAPIWCRC